MKNNKILKMIVVVMFCFIIVLVALLIYANKELSKNSNSADTSTIAQNSSALATSDVSAQTNQVIETIDLKLYFFDADNYEKEKEIRTVTVDKKLYKENITAAINKVLSSTGIKINKAAINGKVMTVDLPKEVALKFNSGSAGGITNTNILAATILNLQDIESLQVTVDGVSGVVADHFNFNGTFAKAENGKKYTFVESDNTSKVLDF